MVVYEFSKIDCNKKYITAFSPIEIKDFYCFDACYNGESYVILEEEINYKSFKAYEY